LTILTWPSQNQKVTFKIVIAIERSCDYDCDYKKRGDNLAHCTRKQLV